MDGLHWASHEVSHGQSSAGPQYPVNLPVQSLLVLDVLGDLLTPDDIEASVRKGHIQRIRLPEGDAVRETRSGRVLGGDVE